MIGKPTKLRSGDWGATVEGKVRKGDVITIRTNAGKEWQALVMKEIWTDGTKTIVATESLDKPHAGRSFGAGSAAPVAGYSSYCTGRNNCGCYDCAS